MKLNVIRSKFYDGKILQSCVVSGENIEEMTKERENQVEEIAQNEQKKIINLFDSYNFSNLLYFFFEIEDDKVFFLSFWQKKEKVSSQFRVYKFKKGGKTESSTNLLLGILQRIFAKQLFSSSITRVDLRTATKNVLFKFVESIKCI